MHVEHPARLFGINQDRACVPAVLNGKVVQLTQDAGRAPLRESVDGDDPHMFSSDARFYSAVEVLARKEFVQVTRDLRECEGMVFAAHATPQIAKKAIMHLRKAVVVSDSQPFQALGLEQLTEHVLEYVNAAGKAVDDLGRRPVGAVRSAAFKHPPLHPLFGCKRRQVSQSQEVFRLVVRAFLHELLPPLIVDDARHAIGERASLGIAGRARSNRVALNHPTAAHSQHGVQPRTERVHLRWGRGHHVGTAIGPAGQ